MFEKKNIKEAPRWGILIFADGYEAQVIGMMPIRIDDKDYWEFTLRPYNPLAKRYNIGLDKVDEDMALVRRYPSECIIPLNLDPINTVYLNLLNFNGQPTVATESLEGKKQADAINSLKQQIFIMKGRIAYLTERLHTAETNIGKYIKENTEIFGSMANQILTKLYAREEQPTTGI